MTTSAPTHVTRPPVRQALLAVGVGLGMGGFVLTWAAGRELVDAKSRPLAVALVGGGAVAFVLTSMCAERVFEHRQRFRDLCHWFAVSVLALVFALGFGYLAVSWTQRRSVPARLGADLAVAVAAGAIAVLPGVISAVVVSRTLGAASRLPAPTSQTQGVSMWMRTEEEQWRPPSGRLSPLLARCVALSVGGMCLSIVAQWISYRADASPTASNLVVPAIAWLVGSGVGWIVVGHWIGFTSRLHRTRHVVHGVGLALVMLSVATAVFAVHAARSANAQLWKFDASTSHGEAGARVEIDGRLAGRQRDLALVHAISPELRFTTGEKWRPTSVQWFKENAQLVTASGGAAARRRGPCSTQCLALPCNDLSGSCTDGAPSNPTIYALVRHGSIGSRIPSGYDDVSTIVQYWLFYNYDSFPRWLLAQWHQGDWEQITIGLAGKRPRFVAYSEHCFGTWLPWTRVPVAGQHSTHPLVFVAEGTHANYPRAFEAPLRGASCTHLSPPHYFGAAGLTFALAEPGGMLEVPADYAFGETDRLGSELGSGFEVRLIDARDPIASFPGTWGLDNRLALGRSSGGHAGAAARSPAHHGEWTDPGRTILCNQKWFHPGRRRCHAEGAGG